jgi:zinc D-Ala-D-Ala carboxypeptidase
VVAVRCARSFRLVRSVSSFVTWKHFKREEFACKGTDCCGGSNLIEDSLIDALDALREQLGFAMPITSGYRCQAHNQKVSGTGPNGPHTTGLAADIGVSRDKAVALLEVALKMHFTGIGLNQTGEGRFVHLDLVPREYRACWTY